MPDIQIHLHHVIFARVERAFSPRNSSGYQIVYQSPALGKETAQIEKRLQCFETGRRRSERYQFFWTERGQAVLAKSVSLIQPDPDVIDIAQRDAFLAHALIVSKEAFASVRNDPFAICEAAEREDLFAQDVEKLVGYLRQEAPVEKLFVPMRKRAEVSYLLQYWRPEELLKLYQLGLQAPTLRGKQQSILLLAEDQDDIFLLLNVILMLVPPEDRVACTFDTCVDGCYPAAGSFWAMGSSRGKSNPGLLSIRLVEQRLEVKGGDDGLLDPKALVRSA